MVLSIETLREHIKQGVRSHYGHTFEEKVDISTLGLNRDTAFENCTFNKDIVGTHLKLDITISFSHCVMKGWTVLADIKLEGFEARGCAFEQLLLVQFHTKTMTIERCTINSGLQITQPEIAYLSITKNTVNGDTFEILGPKIETLHLHLNKGDANIKIHNFPGSANVILGTLSLDFGSDFNTQLVLGMIEVKTLSLVGYNRSSSVAIVDLSVQNITCGLFTNHGVIKVNNLSITSQVSNLHVISSNLGELDLSNIDFSLFYAVIVENSNISGIVPTNVTWCNKIQSQFAPGTNFHKEREVYRQLKNAMIANNDKQHELRYRALEMEAYRKALVSEKGSIWDRVILWTNRVSNLHGLSWVRALAWLLSLNTIAFIGLKCSICYQCFTSLTFMQGLSQLIILLNPVHSLENVFGDVVHYKPHAVSIVDSIMRILNSYLLFQFIRAFRKFTI